MREPNEISSGFLSRFYSSTESFGLAKDIGDPAKEALEPSSGITRCVVLSESITFLTEWLIGYFSQIVSL